MCDERAPFILLWILDDGKYTKRQRRWRRQWTKWVFISFWYDECRTRRHNSIALRYKSVLADALFILEIVRAHQRTIIIGRSRLFSPRELCYSSKANVTFPMQSRSKRKRLHDFAWIELRVTAYRDLQSSEWSFIGKPFVGDGRDHFICVVLGRQCCHISWCHRWILAFGDAKNADQISTNRTKRTQTEWERRERERRSNGSIHTKRKTYR